jgi:hypothetical protein
MCCSGIAAFCQGERREAERKLGLPSIDSLTYPVNPGEAFTAVPACAVPAVAAALLTLAEPEA